MHANLEHKNPTHQQDYGMNQSPQPAGGRADKARLEIAAHKLKQQRSAQDQVLREMTARNCHPTSGYYVEQAPGLFNVLGGGR
jgi:hypothetical protein